MLAAALSANSVQAAPPALAATVAAAAGKSAAGSSIPLLVKGALKLMAWHNAKAAIATGAAIVLAASATPWLVEAVGLTRADVHAEIQGAWETTISTAPFDPNWTFNLHEVLKVTKANGGYRATLDLIELGQRDMPITTVAYRNGNVRLQIHTWGRYQGTVDPTGTEIRGFFLSRNGVRADATWKRTTRPETPAAPLAESEYAPKTNSVFQGFWEGRASFKGIPMRWDLKISEPSPGNFRAEVDRPDIGMWHVPIAIAYERPTVKLRYPGFELTGSMNVDNTEFRVTQPGTSPAVPWTFRRGRPEPMGDFSFTTPADLPGHWQGVVNTEGIKLRVALHIARLPDGSFEATLDCPDQGPSGALATVVRYRPPQLRIEWIWAQSYFAGKLEHGELSGMLGGKTRALPVVFQRSELK